MNKKDCRDRIWDAIDGDFVGNHINQIDGLHESDLEWLVKMALSSHISVTLKVNKNLDNNHISVEIKNLGDRTKDE